MTVRDLARDYDPQILERLHKEVFAPTFVAEELDSLDAMAAGLRGGGALGWVAVGPGDEVLGGLTAERYPGAGVVLVGYLAVRPDRRGGGIGAELMGALLAACEQDAEIRLAIGEVHDPRREGSSGDDRPLDRLRFFGRQGARVLDAPFTQPALRPGGARVPGFLLVAFHVDKGLDGGDGIPAEVVSGFVRSYYLATEGAEPPYDDDLAALIARIERDRTLALLPVSDYERVSA